ncbi:MAG: SUMF1/EgtB/PvdO family nonheme iron enzyme [Hyphomicrobium sp.]
MDIDLDAFSMAAYAGTIIAALLAEFCPWRPIAKPSAYTALVLAVVAGLSWCTLVYQRGYIFSPGERLTASRGSGKGGTISLWAGGRSGGGDKIFRSLGFGGGGDGPGESDLSDGNGGGTGGWTVVLNGGGRDVAEGVDSFIEQLLPARKAKGPADKASPDVEGDIKEDCSSCPEMVIVAGGVALIGAFQSDISASPSERPQRPHRIWPGFAISRQPISAEAFDHFRSEVAMPVRTCFGTAPAPRLSAVCLTADDAEQYAAWLTRLTGKRFRLPTATEWEFAARTKGTTVLAANGAVADQTSNATSGQGVIAAPLEGMGREVAEMTADCFDPYIPQQGRERRTWETNPLLCTERILKGGAAAEAPVHHRYSARRPWRHDEPEWRIGFRVVRPMSGQ